MAGKQEVGSSIEKLEKQVSHVGKPTSGTTHFQWHANNLRFISAKLQEHISHIREAKEADEPAERAGSGEDANKSVLLGF